MAQKAEKVRGLTLQEIERETKQLASDLAFVARAPVSIQLVGGKHIAFTYNTDESKKQHQIPIVMNPDALKKVRNKEQALKIWRGIGYHELAHHLFPAESQYKAAHKEGFKDLFNLVDDEQNERRGRSMDPSWGACFQAVCAHIFSLKTISSEKISPGIIDGGKAGKKPRGIAAAKVYIQRWNQFAVHFRRHIPNPADPVVAEALALIPEDFKDLTKEELLALTRKIHEVFSNGVEMPQETPPKTGPDGKPVPPEEADQDDEENDDADEDEKPPEDEKKDDEKEPEPEKEPEKEEEEPPVKTSWDVTRLLRSKWLYAAFGIFILGWGLVFMQERVSTWVRVAVELTVALSAVTAFLFIRRAYIKMLTKQIAEKIKSIRAGSAATKKDEKKKERIDFRVYVSLLSIASIIAMGVMALHKHGSKGIDGLVGAFIILLAMAGVFFFKRSQKKKLNDNEPLSKPVLALMIAGGLSSLGLTVWALLNLGVGSGWRFWWLFIPLVGILFLVLTVLILACWTRFGQARENGWSRLKRSARERLEDIWERYGWRFLCWIGRGLSRLWGWIARGAVYIWGLTVTAARFIAKWSIRLWWFCQPTLKRLWRNPVTRLFILAAPIAMLLVILRAVLYTAGKTSIWLLIALILLLLALLILGFIFRKKIKRFVMTELFQPMPSLMDVALQGGLDMETEWFVQVDNVVQIEPNQEVLESLQPKIYALAQQLRPYLKKCGRQAIDREDQPEGYDLTDEAELALVGETSIFVDDDVVPKSSLHMEVALDCSSSMGSPTQSLKPGEKFLLGQFFQLVVEQACLNLPGVSAHFWGFTGDQIYDCGVQGEGRSSGLVCGGGNNDAAMLWHMGQSAAASRKDVKILMMLSDGQPSECSWLSLKNLVLQFEQEGMIPWNFALDVIQIPAFERFFTDLVGQSMEEAIVTMGETLAAIAESCN